MHQKAQKSPEEFIAFETLLNPANFMLHVRVAGPTTTRGSTASGAPPRASAPPPDEPTRAASLFFWRITLRGRLLGGSSPSAFAR